MSWQDAADDDVVRNVSIATTKQWQRGSEIGFLFMNDCSRDQDPLAQYGADNVAKLKAISRKYDPDQVFQSLQNNGVLLRKVSSD